MAHIYVHTYTVEASSVRLFGTVWLGDNRNNLPHSTCQISEYNASQRSWLPLASAGASIKETVDFCWFFYRYRKIPIPKVFLYSLDIPLGYIILQRRGVGE